VDAATRTLNEALTRAEVSGNAREIAAALSAVAHLLRITGDLQGAAPRYQRSLALSRELEDHEYTAISLLNLAMIDIERRALSSAKDRMHEALALSDAIGSSRLVQSVLEVAAGFAVANEDWRTAMEWFYIAERLASATGLRRDPTDEAFLLPLIAEASQHLEPETIREAAARYRHETIPHTTARLREWLARSVAAA
jgi:hypothetical protein